MNEELRKKLSAPMPYKWRVQSAKYGKATCVAYVDARDVMNRLDDVLGINGWQDSYEEHKGNLFCTISIKTGDNVWVKRSDCGVESNMEAQKGEASDAFKRAAVKFGVGRFLYDLGVVTLKTRKHTNDKEYPCTADGRILWTGDEVTDYIKSLQASTPQPTSNTQATTKKQKATQNIFSNMLKAIEDGKADAVRARLANYEFTDEQKDILRNKLK